VFTVLMTAFVVLLARWSGQRDIVVGVPVKGRNPKTEGAVGLFVNTLAVRIGLADFPSFGVLIQRVRSALLGAYRNQDAPFEKVVQSVQSKRDMGRHPICQVAFNYRPLNIEATTIEGLSLTVERLATDTAKFDLELRIEKCGDGLLGDFDYASTLFDQSTVQRFSGHLQTLLDAAGKTPEKNIFLLTLLSEPERRQITVDWNDTARRFAQII
jgi:non-ribosomal peptide synthetase component F